MTTIKPINFNNIFIKDLTNDLSIAVPTLITLTIKEQPQILNAMKQISQIEHSVLQKKVKEFMNNASFFDDYLNVVLYVYLSTLMYDNDIFPNFIHAVLVETGTTDITIEDLKVNATTLINMLINKQTNNMKGGNPFKRTIKLFYPIALVILIICIDYNILLNPKFSQAYQTASEAYSTISLVANPDTDCGNIKIPYYLEMFDKYHPEWNVKRYYTAVECVSQKKMDEYLERHPDFAPTFPEMEPSAFSADVTEDMSTALVPYDASKVSTEIAIVGNKCSDMLNSVVVYDETGAFNMEKSMETLDEYIRMTDDEIFELFFPKEKTTERSDSPIGLQEMASDAISILYNMFQDITKQTGISPAFTIKTSLTRTFKKYCIQKRRQLEDMATATKRQMEDYVNEIAETFEDITDFLSLLPWLIALNSTAIFFVLAFIKNLLGAIRGPTDMLEIEATNNTIPNNTIPNNTIPNRPIRKTRGATQALSSLEQLPPPSELKRLPPPPELKRLPPPTGGRYNRKHKTRRNKKRRTKHLKGGKRRNTKRKQYFSRKRH